jgi:short-chain fatty acids transporter
VRAEGLAKAIRTVVPDPFVVALGLTGIAFALAWWLGGESAFGLTDAWVRGADMDGTRVGGVWSLLSFSMQMCLMLVTGHVVASTRPARAFLGLAARWASGPRSSVVLVTVVAMLLGWVHWGLGLVGGALLAREVGGRLRGGASHYPALAAGGYMGLVVWHAGLSGSAPLKVTRRHDLEEVLGRELAARVGELSLFETVLSTSNLLTCAALLVVVPATLALLVPANPLDREECPLPVVDTDPPGPARDVGRHRWMGWIVILPAAWWLGSWIMAEGVDQLTPDVMNLAFLALGLALAGGPIRYMALAEDAVRACVGIIVQFPMYGGIMGVLAGGGVLSMLARSLPEDGTFLALATFGTAGLINLFVPSGGGQWAVQGPVVMAAAVEAQVNPARVVMALAYGDQWTNLFQPFWALPLLGITGARAGDLLGHTVIVGVVAGLVFLVAVAVA